MRDLQPILYIHQCFSNRLPLTICRCAASFFKVLYADTNFLPKLKKCCHEVMADNCYKSRVALHLPVTAKEVMTFFVFFWISAPFRASSHNFRKELPGEVVISAVTSSFGALVQTSIMGPHFLVQNVQLGYFLQYRNHCVSLGFFDDSVL